MSQKRIYWGSTALLALLYLAGGVFYLSATTQVQAIWGQLGFPGYLVPILAIVKLTAAVVILWRPVIALVDLTYAGMFFHLLLAVSAHANAGDGGFVPALIGLVLIVLSYFTQNAARAKASPYGRWPLTT
ncbi:DoxX family protein [Pseudomonas sp. NPDC089918]|uniref:DoxX family protein n=1 Tax=Pseudomonas sp. NPDC089918 TaxID=3390654 RepID=UPI003D0028D2